ncbi:MAG TPA: GNAT family N-acetyltransferase [Pyrinomonadaceae bacterium]
MTFILETERLALREWEPEDAGALFVLMSDAEVMRYVDVGKPWEDVGRVRDWIVRMRESYRARGYSRWAVAERDGGAVVGSCGFALLPWSGEVDFGYMLRRDRWGRGYASEIGRAALRHGFERYGFREVVASIAPENAASRRVLEKLGFVYRGNEVMQGEEEESEIYVAVNPAAAAAAQTAAAEG